MTLSQAINNTNKLIRSNSTGIFAALGIVGVATTSYLSAKGAFKAANILKDEDENLPVKEKAKIVWKVYIPATISGVATISFIFASAKVSSRKTAAAVAAYSITEKAFSEYKEKVVEEIGKSKEQKIRDEIAQDRILKKPNSEVVMLGAGHILCCELYTHRYFRSDMETLRKAQNDINSKIVAERYVTISEFYDLVGLSYTSVSYEQGWDNDKLLELKFSTVISDNGEPCLAFDYNYVKPI